MVKAWNMKLALLVMVVALFGALLMTACTDEPEPEPTAAEPTPVPTAAPTAVPTAEPTQVPATPTPAPAPRPAATSTSVARATPTPVPPPPATPTPAPVEVEAALAEFSSDLFDFSFEYPEGWELSEEDRRITVTVPGKSVEVAVSIHILTTPQGVHEYTELVLEALEEEYPEFLVRLTAGRQVGEVPGLINRAQSTAEDGTETIFKVYTAAIGRVGVTFVLSGVEADVAGVEGQFDALADSSRFPSGSLEVPETTINKQAVGTGLSASPLTINGEGTVFERDNGELYAVVDFENLPVDRNVEFLWVKVDRFTRVESLLQSVEADSDGGVHWSTYAPADGLELGFYIVAVLVDESFVEYLPFTVVIEEGAEFEDALTYEDWAAFLLNVGDLDRAIYAATKSIELDPNEAQPYIWRAEAYEQQCKIRPAIADHAEAVKLLPDNPVTVATRGHAFWYAFDYQLALEDYSRALELVEELPRETDRQIRRYTILSAAFHNNRALVRVNLGQIGEAIDDINVSLELEPNEHNHLDTRAYAYYKGGRYAEAKVDYERALELGFENLYVYLGLGLTHIALGERDEGRASLELGLKLFEEYDEGDCPDPQLGDLIATANSILATLPA